MQVTVRSDSKKMNQGIELSNIVHHRRACEAPPMDTLQATGCARCFSVLVLDALSFVQNDSVELTCGAKEGEKHPHRRLIRELITFLLLFFEVLDESAIFSPKSAIGGQHYVEIAQLIPRKFFTLPMDHMSAQSVTRFNLCSYFAVPLSNKCDRTYDEGRLMISERRRCRDGIEHTLRARSVGGRLKRRAKAVMVFPSPISSARIPPLFVPSSCDFTHVNASF